MKSSTCHFGAGAADLWRPAHRRGARRWTLGRIHEDVSLAAVCGRRLPPSRRRCRELGQSGGLMDAARRPRPPVPVALIVDPALECQQPQQRRRIPPASRSSGQFLDHDMTFDTGVPSGGADQSTHRPATRGSPFFDLDSVYGDGPSGYAAAVRRVTTAAKLRVESQRRCSRTYRATAPARAIIADPRNDENLDDRRTAGGIAPVSQSRRRSRPCSKSVAGRPRLFSTKRAGSKTWHYQWVILHEFLPQIVGPSRRGGRHHAAGGASSTPAPGEAFIPIEFQIAYRFGHSMVQAVVSRELHRRRMASRSSRWFSTVPPASAEEPPDLRGGCAAPRRFVGWQTFFRFPGHEADVRPNKRIDTKLSTPLFDLPLGAIAAGTPPTSLAERNLLRHLTWRVPSGQAIATAMGAPGAAATPILPSSARCISPAFVRSTPLWYYVLQEAEVLENGATPRPHRRTPGRRGLHRSPADGSRHRQLDGATELRSNARTSARSICDDGPAHPGGGCSQTMNRAIRKGSGRGRFPDRKPRRPAS